MKFELNTITALLSIIAMLIIVTIVLYKRLRSVARRPYQKVMDTEIPADIEAILLPSGESGTTVFKQKAGSAPSTTNFREINLYDLVSVLKSDSDNEGFYIYPIVQIEDSSKIDYVLAIDKNKLGSHTYVYYLLSKNYSGQGTLASAITTRANAMSIFKNYHDKIISIEHADYYGNKSRPSRFYTSADFYTYLRRMGLKPLSDNIDALKDYVVRIKGAAINETLAKEIELYFRDEIPAMSDYKIHIGFTAYLYIQKGELRAGMAFEIGKPCPPRCGELRAE